MDQEIEAIEVNGNKKKLGLIILLIAVLIVVGAAAYFLWPKDAKETVANEDDSTIGTTEIAKTWQEGGVAIAGKYADSEIVDPGNGQYRMYYSEEPEVNDFQARVFSAVSSDGINWTDEGEIKRKSTFADVIKLPDGRWRMYFQNSGVVKSAVSIDGLKFTDEAGARIDKDETGFTLENVGATSTIQLSDGTYLMIYRGTINQPYQGTMKVPNNNTQIYFYAISNDGLTFEKKGLAIDSRNDELYNFADGGEFVSWTNEATGETEIRAYFWSYNGIYHSKYENGTFSTPEFVWTNNNDKSVVFVANPASDPTFIKISDNWFMYFGQHEKGIYYAEYK
ncbi:MAG: hypothetical protein WC107_01075 [Patescibacteria group bacterium]